MLKLRQDQAEELKLTEFYDMSVDKQNVKSLIKQQIE